MSRRATILEKLKTLLAASATFKTVKLVTDVLDRYPIDIEAANMPAIKIVVPDEKPNYTVGMRAMNHIRPELHLYVIEWNNESITNSEAAIEVIREILGEHYTIDGTAVNIDILSIFKENSTYPLIHHRILCEVLDEGSITSL